MKFQKKLFQYLLLLLTVPFSNEALSAAYSFTFEGFFTGIYGAPEVVNNLDVAVGDFVRYVHIVDTNENGYFEYGDGSFLCRKSSISESEKRIPFFAVLIEMSYSVDGTYYGWNNAARYAENIDSLSFPDGPFTRLFGGPDSLYIDANKYIDSWELGDEFGGAHLWHDNATTEFISMYTNLVLVKKEKVEYELDYLGCVEEAESAAEEPQSENNISQGGGSVSPLLFVQFCLIALFFFFNGRMHNNPNIG